MKETGGLLGDDMVRLFVSFPSSLINPVFSLQGLGKTIQVIAFLSAEMGASPNPPFLPSLTLSRTGKTGFNKHDVDKRKNAINALGPDGVTSPTSLGKTCLIVCPASVVHNWAREFQTVRLLLSLFLPLTELTRLSL
jgi:SNF2 family DNA or RNA helicase